MRGVPGGVVHHELHVGELARDRHDVVGVVEGRVEVDQREALVGDEDLHPEVVRVLNGGQADDGVLEREASAARAPCRVHLERGGSTELHRARHLVEGRGHGPDVGGDDVLDEDPAGAAAGQAGGDVLRRQRLGERDGRVGGARVRDVGEHRHRRVAGQEEVVEIGGPVHAVQLRGVGAAGREHGEHEPRGLGGVLDPGSARDHVVGVHVEDELGTGQGLLAGRGVRGRGRGEAPAPGTWAGGRTRMRRGRAAGELEGGEGRRHGARALQEAPAVDAQPLRRVVDVRPDELVDLAVPRLLRGPGRIRRWTRDPRRVGGDRRADPAAGGRTGRSQPWR